MSGPWWCWWLHGAIIERGAVRCHKCQIDWPLQPAKELQRPSNIIFDLDCPPNEAHFYQDGRYVGKIINMDTAARIRPRRSLLVWRILIYSSLYTCLGLLLGLALLRLWRSITP